jgi:hypothetical protein
MEIINNIEWVFENPKTAKNKDTKKLITQKELETIVFDNSVNKNVIFSLPLNDNFLFIESRELSRPITVEQILTLIHNFYKEPLKEENIDKAFEENEEWKENIIDEYDGDIRKLTNYDVFSNICATPDFCGLNLIEGTDEYFVSIGPE